MAHRRRPEHPMVKALEQPGDRYRWLVGEFVLRMADVEYLVADSVDAVLGSEDPRAQRAWAGSGAQLVAAVESAETRAPELKEMRIEYAELSKHRNVLVHGMYNGHQVTVDGEVLHGATKPDRWSSGTAAHPFTQERWTEQEIWDWVSRAMDLALDALSVITEYRRDAVSDGAGPLPEPAE